MKAGRAPALARLQVIAEELAVLASESGIPIDYSGPADHVPAAVSDSRIVIEPSDASPPTAEKTMSRIHGPYPDRKGWRIKIVERATGKTTSHSFATEEEAAREVERMRRKAARELGVSVETALAEYERYLLAKGCKARSVKSTFQRLRAVFKGHEHRPAALTDDEAAVIWSEYFARPTRFKAPPATDTQMNVLHETRTFTRWCESKRWSKIADPFAESRSLAPAGKGKTRSIGSTTPGAG
jgi:hypothetical protein